MHGEETEVVEGYGKKKKKGHDCASKVKHEEFGIGYCIKGQHTILEDGTVGHYDVEFEEYIVENCPVEELEILVSEMHMHKEMKEGVVKKEVKALQKAGKTLKDTPVVKADKIDMPSYKEDKDWIQKAVKRPGAFTRKAKAAGMGVQQFAKSVDANPGKYSTRTKKQANLAQTFASMKKETFKQLTEVSAFDFVKSKIEKEVGKGGYVSKDNPRKPQTPAEKAKVRAHQAKVDKENAAERKKDPSQGRYPKG